MRIYYVINARVPTKKAYGIQIAKMCEAFIEAGVDLVLVIPNTKVARTNPPLHEFYRLRVKVPTIVLPALDRYGDGRWWFFVSSLVFMVSSSWFLWMERWKGKKGAIYTIDMDTFSFVPLVFSGFSCIAEMQELKPSNFLTRAFFKRVRGVVALNAKVRDALRDAFGLPPKNFIVENNGVELDVVRPSRDEARRTLGLSVDGKILLYVGRFYDWKGLAVVPIAAREMPDIAVTIVGGTREDFERATNVHDIPENMRFMGECASYEVPTWLAAADALLVVGTKEYGNGFLYRSPMKTYEYMAAERPVVAPNTPALKAIAPAETAVFYEPDDAVALTHAARKALAGGPEIDAAVESARALVIEHSWLARVRRILAFMQERNV